MKVFISWSGLTSKAIAEALRNWIPGVLQAVKPYFSPDDIAKGSIWSSEISKELEESRIGIICLTRNNLSAPWILFEAGALSKNIDKSKVCPILFGVEPTDLEGPLVQFQAAKFSEDELRRVIIMMNTELGDRALTSEVFESVFNMWYPILKAQIDKVLTEEDDSKSSTLRSERDLLEEILNLSRSIIVRGDKLHSGPQLSQRIIRDLTEGLASIVSVAQKNGLDKDMVIALHQLYRPIDFIIRKNVPNFNDEDDDTRIVLRKVYYEIKELRSMFIDGDGLLDKPSSPKDIINK